MVFGGRNTKNYLLTHKLAIKKIQRPFKSKQNTNCQGNENTVMQLGNKSQS